MYSSGLGGGSGSGIDIFPTVPDLPVSAPDGQVVFVQSTRKLYAFNVAKMKWVVVGGEGAMIGRVNQTAIPNATQTMAVVFGEVMPSTEYSILTNIVNTTDTDPIWLQVVSTIKSTTGFTVYFNAPTDTANYVLEWACPEDAPEEVP